MSKPARLHLIDGTYELFRAHYSPRPGHRTPGGRERKATVGFLSSMLALLHDREEAVTHVAVAFDNPIRSFRNDLFDGYKGDEGVDPGLREQFDDVERAAAALGLRVWSMDRFEADDALGTAAARFADAVEQVRILSPDKDMGQCVRGDRVVLVDRRQKKTTDEAGLRALRGFGPASIPDWLALVGDTADGIPGLEGFGDKAAATLLGAYEHIEHIPADAASWKPRPRGAERLAATLAAGRGEALLYRRLATLSLEAPIDASLDALAFAGTPRRAYEALCDELGLDSLRTRPRAWR